MTIAPLAWFGIAAAAAYGAALLLLTVYAVHSLWLLRVYLRHRRAALQLEREERSRPLPPAAGLPHVLVQLPVFNERDVVERVVAAAGELRWPRDRLTVQLLDDSTDDSVERGARAIATLRARGIDAQHVCRRDRVGFKAGALAHGLDLCPAAELVAIFDADFVPPADFLERAARPLLAEPRLALVQGRWEHLNPTDNRLTEAQTIGIDAHFSIEQGARAWGGYALNFNGTCGLWRRAAIDDAGGWQHDTLTEDLDLSYRAQLRGWRCTYRQQLAVPGELPTSVHAWRAQQFRWAKGSQQTTRKLAGAIWRSDWPLHRKLAALLHTSHYAVHPMIVLSMIAAPVAATFAPLPPWWISVAWLLLFAVGLLSPLVVYAVSQRALGRPWATFARRVPMLAAFGTGIALSNARAVVEAWAGRASPFERTPKSGGGRGSYRARSESGIPELLASVWAVLGIVRSIAVDRAFAAPLMLVYSSGFLVAGWMCLSSVWRARAPVVPFGRARWLALVGCGTAALLGYLCVAAHPGRWVEAPLAFAAWGLLAGAAYLLAIPLVRRSTPRATMAVLAFALLFRLIALGVAPSDDIARYVAEATLLVRGGNPYATAPADAATVQLLAGHVAPAVLAEVNHPEWTAIYPPIALLLQSAIAQVATTVSAQRASSVFAELLALAVVLSILVRRGRPAAQILLVAWNPVTVLWIAGEGHNDSYSMLALVLAAWAFDRRNEFGGVLAGSIAALCKPFAVVALAPSLARGFGWRWLLPLGLAVACYLPFVGAGAGMLRSLGRFGTELSFAGALQPWLAAALRRVGCDGATARVVTMLLLAALLLTGTAMLLRRRSVRRGDDDPLVTTGWLLALLLVCLPTLHPWYLTALVPFLPFLRSRALQLWTAAAPVHWLHGLAMAGGAQWAELPWVTATAHLPAMALLAVEFRPRRRREHHQPLADIQPW